jgi:isochorismate synthase
VATTLSESSILLRGFTQELRGFGASKDLGMLEFWASFGDEVGSEDENTGPLEYQNRIQAALDKIGRQELGKVVISRSFFWNESNANAQATFSSLLDRYPTCTVFALQDPHYGHWMGASPEVLFEKTTEGYRSMSLAGTRLKGGLTWGEKEIEEQKFVTKEIHRTLKNLGGHVRRDPQTTLNAGPVEHLMTWVRTDNTSLVPLEALEALHPTPAVCGAPTDLALQVIQELEGYSRDLYTGYLAFVEGPVYANVLLRTMRWFRNGIKFYAGGGITKDSVPLNEWMETEYKISALKDAVQIK